MDLGGGTKAWTDIRIRSRKEERKEHRKAMGRMNAIIRHRTEL